MNHSRLQPVLFRAATSSSGVSCLLTLDSFPITVLSLSSIHIPRIESLFRFHFKGFRSSPFQKRPPACQWSFTGLRSCVVSNFFLTLRFDLNATMASFFSSWRRDSILRPSERTYQSRNKVVRSSPRPGCLEDLNFRLLSGPS